MPEPRREPAPFDEQAALAELDRLRAEIEQQAARRRAAEEEFDAFVRSFKTPVDATIADPATDLVRRRETPVEPAVTAVRPGPPAVRPSRTPAVVGTALILVTAAGFGAWMLRGRTPEPAPTTFAPAPAEAPPPTNAPTRAAAPPAATSPHGGELTTIRRAWVRVIVDGERVLEREVPAGSRVPLTAQKTIVIRTGDAGAVRLSIGGRDQGFLGREGEVVTRTYTVPRTPDE